MLFIGSYIFTFLHKFRSLICSKSTSYYLRKHCITSSPIKISDKCILNIFPGANVRIGSNLSIGSGIYTTISDGSYTQIIVKSTANLFIGNNVGISSSQIHCWQQIIIGNNVNIGFGCLIIDTNFHSLDFNCRNSNRGHEEDFTKTASIIIEDNCFIGARCIINKGVKIGKNSILAAGSVVIKNIPNNEIWGGNPARFIKKIF